MSARITRVGNTLTVEIPEKLAAEASLAAGDAVEWVASGVDGIALVKRAAQPRPKLAELLADLPENVGEYDWGEARGVEAW